MTKAETLVSIEELSSLISYDPDLGTIIRKKDGKTLRGMKMSNGYLVHRFFGCNLRAHRIAFALMTGRWPSHDIDHQNGVRDDNRWNNLREATRSQNLRNSALRPHSRSGFKGVYQPKGKQSFTAYISIGNRKVHLGQFRTAAEAHARYMQAAKNVAAGFARS